MSTLLRQKSFSNELPTLYLVATPIGNLDEMTPRAIEILKNVDVIAAEDTRNTMKLLKHFNIETRCIAHHDHNEKASAQGLLNLLNQGQSIAVVSDAGYPLISDPGQLIVEQVVLAGYNVVPISGSNAMLNALVASGLCAQPFLFKGFLSSNDNECRKELNEVKGLPYTLILYEAPHRIERTCRLLLEVLGNRRVCLAREITKKFEEFIRGNLNDVIEVADEIKGEMVIVIDGNHEPDKPSITMSDLSDKINEYIQSGMTTSDAIKMVSKEYGLSKNEVYNSFHNN